MSARPSLRFIAAAIAVVLTLAPVIHLGTAAEMGAMAAGAADRMAPADCDCCPADTSKTSDTECVLDCTVPGGILSSPPGFEAVSRFRPAVPQLPGGPDRISAPDPSPPRPTIIG
jgi:hypothetical protein